jgi:hypothetical protein
MGTVLTFPEPRLTARDALDPQNGSATVIILPVVRIERYDGDPSGDADSSPASPRRRRRRRSSRG